jgi:hypothetical protein
MTLSQLRTFVIARYEHLFARRFRLENERDLDVYPTLISPPRRRFSRAGAIFPTEAILPRYQY